MPGALRICEQNKLEILGTRRLARKSALEAGVFCFCGGDRTGRRSRSNPPPDLNCKDISHRRFRLLSLDPHRFDGDNDGIGCES